MIEYLGKEIIVKIDRPMGSKHPKHKFIYPVNYGYIEGTKSGDGEEIDVYVLGIFEPIDNFKGKVIGIIKGNDDVEDKLVVAKELNSYDKYQIKALTEFQERFFDSEIITLDYLRSSIRNTVRGLLRRENKVLVLEEEYKMEQQWKEI
jgi:inorganic pyrophosphatase